MARAPRLRREALELSRSAWIFDALGPQSYDLQLTQYDDRGWRATFYTTGMGALADRGTFLVSCASGQTLLLTIPCE